MVKVMAMVMVMVKVMAMVMVKVVAMVKVDLKGKIRQQSIVRHFHTEGQKNEQKTHFLDPTCEKSLSPEAQV